MKELTETRSKVSFAVLILGLAAASFATAADLNVPTAGYPTIQAAVNAANTDDTIHIAPGVYTGQVQIISKTLTLIGQPGAILRATETMPPFSGSPRGNVPIMGIRYSQVTVRGLTFEGERLAGRVAPPGLGHLVGIYFRQSSGNVESCAFYGFRESTPGTASANVITVVSVAADATDVNFRVVGSTFADNYDGIFCVGSATHQSINVTVENNTIVGPGPLENLDCQGIFIREGVGGRIAGNTISRYSYVGTAAAFPIGFGILAANEANSPAFGILQPLIIEGNTLRDNQAHIVLIKGDGSVVRNNRFQGTAPGIIPAGLGVTGNGVVIANNQFEKMSEGIRLMGNDPTFGTLLGIAVDAQVASNRFCEVTTPITVQPLASATQTGTLLCPFPPPPLAIAPAVLLSWPAEDDGWTVESATSVDGPWAASDATPFTQDGRHSIAVPTDGEHRFFRLRNPCPFGQAAGFGEQLCARQSPSVKLNCEDYSHGQRIRALDGRCLRHRQGHGPGNAVVTQSGSDICPVAVRVDRTQNHAGVQFVNGQFMSTLEVGPENRGPVKLTNCGFWGTEATREHVRHLGPSSLILTACHFTGWDHARKGDPCIRAAGGRLIVNGCDFMDDGKQAILLEKGLKAATILGCCFRGAKGVEDQSGGDVQVGLNTGTAGRKG